MAEVELEQYIEVLNTITIDEEKLVMDLRNTLANAKQSKNSSNEKSAVYDLLSQAYQRHIGIIDGLTLAKEALACNLTATSREE